MYLVWKFFLLMAWTVDVGFCQTEVNNSTTNSKREIMEQQARQAYQNACFRLQELSNWMAVLFKIKGVWASSTVNQIAAKSEGVLDGSDRRSMRDLPSRPKTYSECSLRSVQVTIQTYAYLQSQLLLLKMITGRRFLRSGKETFEGANVSLRERMKTLDTFNATLNNILYKLRQSTQDFSTQINSENSKVRNIMQDIQEGRFLQYLQRPKKILRNIFEDQTMYNSINPQAGSRNFFQNLGKTLDRLIFQTNYSEQNSTVGFFEKHIDES